MSPSAIKKAADEKSAGIVNVSDGGTNGYFPEHVMTDPLTLISAPNEDSMTSV